METSVKNYKINTLKELYKKTGNCVMNGYLGEALDNVYLDDNDEIIFNSHHEAYRCITDSRGVVLDDSVLIKQIQNDGKNSYYQIFSWNVLKTKYSYILFDSCDVMDFAYEKLKAFNYSLCDVDIVSIVRKIGVNFENISNILLDQQYEVDDTIKHL